MHERVQDTFEPSLDQGLRARLNAEARASLVQHGFERLVPLLNRDFERRFLFEVEGKLFQKWVDRNYTDFHTTIMGIPVRLRAIPEDGMNVFCGLMTQNGKEVPRGTPVGKMIWAAGWMDPHKARYTFAIDGLAEDITGFNGLNNRPMAKVEEYYPKGSWPVDGDVLVVGDGSLSGIRTAILDGKRWVWWSNYKVKEKTSLKRDGFQFLDIGRPAGRIQRWDSLAQVSFPEYGGVYSSEISLIQFLMNRPDRPGPVMVMPIFTNEKETFPSAFIGGEINLFAREEEPSPHFVGTTKDGKVVNVKYQKPSRNFSDAFSIIDTQNSGQEPMYHFCHMIRRCAWDNSCPTLWGMGVANSSKWFFENLVLKITVADYDWLLGSTEVRNLHAKELISSLRSAFMGDPAMTFLRCLPAEFGGIKNPNDLGIISEEGFLNGLYPFFSDNGWMNSLNCLKVLNNCPKGKGFNEFVGFVRANVEVKGALVRVVKMFTPCFYSLPREGANPTEISEIISHAFLAGYR